MLFAIYALDKEDSIRLRMDTREKHLAYLANSPLVFAGPLLDDEGSMLQTTEAIQVSSLNPVLLENNFSDAAPTD